MYATAKADIGECQAIRDAISHCDARHRAACSREFFRDMLKMQIPCGFSPISKARNKVDDGANLNARAISHAAEIHSLHYISPTAKNFSTERLNLIVRMRIRSKTSESGVR